MPRGAWFALCLLSVHTAALAAVNKPLPIIPRPATVKHLNGAFLVGPSAVIYADGDARPIAQWLAGQLQSEFGIAAQVLAGAPRGRAFRLTLDEKLPEEGYRLRIDPRGVIIVGRPAGLFYGAQSVLQLAAARTGAPVV